VDHRPIKVEWSLASFNTNWRTENSDQRGGEWKPQISSEIFGHYSKITPKPSKQRNWQTRCSRAKQWLDVLGDDRWTQQSTQTGKKLSTTSKHPKSKNWALNSNGSEERTQNQITTTNLWLYVLGKFLRW
jgi:hypothetical protein